MSDRSDSLRVVVDVGVGGPVHGLVHESGGRRRMFVGWDGLAATLECARRRARSPAEQPDESGADALQEAAARRLGVTASEFRVAAMAARGLSNREIADALSITRKTVEKHLGNAYAKVGVASRIDLAIALAELAGDRRDTRE